MIVFYHNAPSASCIDSVKKKGKHSASMEIHAATWNIPVKLLKPVKGLLKAALYNPCLFLREISWESYE
jgi:hypothetical protein